MAFVPRLNDIGILNNPMWYSDNFYYQIGWGMPNCTAYCYGRIYEILQDKPVWCPRFDANTWWRDWPENLAKGQSPRLGAVQVMYDPYGYYMGHVAVVEQILPNGNIITSNSGYQGDFFWTDESPISNNYIPDWAAAKGYRLHGFCYLPGVIASEWIRGNMYLGQADMDNNAFMAYSKLYSLGWTLEAVCGVLGNFARESTINPGVWENLTPDPNVGFGLAQWTPATNWLNYAIAQGWATDDGDRQLEFCDTDPIANYIPTTTYPETLEEFKHSTESPEYLASAWLYNYERAGVVAEDERRRWARYYYDLFKGITPWPPHPGGEVTGLKIWQMIKYRY